MRTLAQHQRGQSMMLIAVLIVLAVSAVIYTTAGSNTLARANREAVDNDAALAQVRDALIAWSAARTPTASSVNIRPGELPCPDNDNSGTDSGSCVAGAIGRVPWKSLGIPEPKDSAGETLWYAIAGPFRNYNMSSSAITSNTQGNLTVYHGGSSTTVTSAAIAVVFSPGQALSTQDRNASSTALCATTGTTIARNLCAANYLEAVGSGNNAQTGGPFVQAAASGSFNDRLLVITNELLMPLVEQRVAREMIGYLNSYKAALATSTLYGSGAYPWADLADGNSNGSSGAAYNRNRFPCNTALPVNWGTVPTLGSAATPTLPNWLRNGCTSLTGWASVIYYAVSKNELETGGVLCTTCSGGNISVTNAGGNTAIQCTTDASPTCAPQVISSGNADMLLITPGAFTGSPARNWPTSWSNITGYFSDSENADNNDDTYVAPSTSGSNRDRIFIVR